MRKCEELREDIQSSDSSGSSDDEGDEEEDSASSESSVDVFEDVLINSSESGDNENDEEEGLGFSERSEDLLIDFNERKDDEAEDQLIKPSESNANEAPDVPDGNDDTADEGSDDNAIRWPIVMNDDDAEDESSEIESSDYIANCGGYATTLEFYHPGKDEWIGRPGWSSTDRRFVAHGKLHRMTLDENDVYGIDKNDGNFLTKIRLRKLFAVWPLLFWKSEKKF